MSPRVIFFRVKLQFFIFFAYGFFFEKAGVVPHENQRKTPTGTWLYFFPPTGTWLILVFDFFFVCRKVCSMQTTRHVARFDGIV